MVYSVKKGDLLPPFQVKLTLGSTPIDLAGAVGVTFSMTPRGSTTPQIDERPCTVLQNGTVDVGWVEYEWAAGDTSVVGIFDAEFRINWPSAKPQTVPNDEYIVVKVLGSLG